jgi:nucleotide-binding universal stress UspA family protein
MVAVSAPPVVSLQNILVATDFSPCSQIALHCAAVLARQAKGNLFLAHVLSLAPMLPIPMDAGPVFPAPISKDPSFRLKQLVSSPDLAGIRHETLLGQGDLWLVLQDMIEQHDIELVVIGTHGREGLKKLMLGSVAEEVFRRAPCPVVTVGPHVAPECFEQGRLRRVLFATDLLPSSLHALAHAVSLAQLHQAPLTVVHAIPCATTPYEDFGPITVADEEIREARSQATYLLPDGVQADVVVEVGLPDQIIVEVARRQKASMIVLGLHPQTSAFVAEHLPWTTAHHVVCAADCPVMTVK